jgi:ABC-type nitrate/sulfonate/bicarbonate transport system permease component
MSNGLTDQMTVGGAGQPADGAAKPPAAAPGTKSAVVASLPAGARFANRGERRRAILPLSVLSIVALLVVWYVLTDATGTIDSLYFPSYSDVGHALDQLGTRLLSDAWATTWRVLLSWGIGCSAGVVTGLLIGRSRVLYSLANPLIEALRPVPPIALIPFVILWFGLGETGRILLGSLSCFMIMVVTTHVAARNVNPVYLQAARTLGASENVVYLRVVLRAIVPHIISGLRIAAALSWAVIVAAEYLGAQNGIGYLILQASRTLNTSVVLLGTIVIGLLAFVFETLIGLAAERATRWVERGA